MLAITRGVSTTAAGARPVAATVLLCVLFAATKQVGADEPESCFACHPAPGLEQRIREGQRTTPELEALIFKGSSHVKLSCRQCHPTASRIPHPKDMHVTPCESCHHGIQPHIPPLRAKDKGLRGCIDCHGYHDIRPTEDSQSPVARANIPALCAKCHGRPEGKGQQYFESVHGVEQLEKLGSKAAVCTDCHGSHPEKAGQTLLTGVERARVPHTCGKCHTKTLQEYEGSVHGQALARGVKDVPVCSTCHGEHNIRSPEDERSPVYTTHVADTCGSCHAALPLTAEYGLQPEQYQSYRDSYHGVANKLGSLTAANCASCHGAHDIRPSNDPQSSINPANLPTTCGKCHEGMNANVSRGKIHVLATRTSSPIIFWVSFGFRWLTIGIMAALIGHIILDLTKRVKERRQSVRSETFPDDEEPLQRFSLVIRLQHIVLAVSCLILIFTGLPLKFPHWTISELFINSVGGVHAAGLLHRIGATLLIGVGLFHMVWLPMTQEGRTNFRHLLPTFYDVRCVITNVLWFLGLTPERAKVGRYSYIEKFDYWAVYWGCVIMIGSGLMLWADEITMRLLPKLYMDVAREAHSDEALLATLAIFIWHFYNVHLNPDHFPMSKVWLTGRITKREMREHHPLEYEQMVAELGSQNTPPVEG